MELQKIRTLFRFKKYIFQTKNSSLNQVNFGVNTYLVPSIVSVESFSNISLIKIEIFADLKAFSPDCVLVHNFV